MVFCFLGILVFKNKVVVGGNVFFYEFGIY